MSVKADLIAARKLIEKPENWTQGEYRGHENGMVTYCLVGAIHYVNENYFDCAYEAMQKFMDMSLENFNDTHTHAEVLELLDRAITAQTEG